MLAVVATLLFALFPAQALPGAPPSVSTPVADSLTHYYVRQDADALRRLLDEASSREERLLVRYRLYPLTQDEAVIGRIPEAESVSSPRELALISALWAYRAASGPAWRLPTYGRRSERILDRAADASASDPYVLLVRGQSLYYKPRMFGGDVREAKAVFERLRTVLGGSGVAGLHPFEAEVWIWMCERKLNRRNADRLKETLLGQDPPPLFRQFLQDPP